jgi:hypothetical protein
LIFCTECNAPASFIAPGAAPIASEAFGIPISIGTPAKGWCTRCWMARFTPNTTEDMTMARKPKHQDTIIELAHEDEIEQLNNECAEETHELAAATATGDLRDFILNRLRYEQDKRPWNQRSESDQHATVASVEASCSELVTKLIEMLAAGGRKTISCTLSQATVKDGIKAVLEISKHDALRHILLDSIGSRVLIVVADPSDFQGERAPAEIKPDQGELPKTAMVVHSTADDLPFLPN